MHAISTCVRQARDVAFSKGGGSIQPPKTGGEGAQLTRQLISYELGSIFFTPSAWQMMISLNPLDALIPKIPLSCFAEFWVRVTSGARGSVAVGFWRGRQLNPFWERGG